MSIQGILVIAGFGLALIGLIVHLVRIQKLHVGYGILWLATTAGVLLLVTIPPLLSWVTRAVGALFPASALSLLAFWFIFVVLIFFSVKLTALSARQTELIQALALRELEEREAAKPPIAQRDAPPAGPTADE